MSWAIHAIETLKEGRAVILNPKGSSMEPKISSGDRVTVAPCDPKTLNRGDIVLARVQGRDYLHLIKGIKKGQVLIGNNKGHVNGWTSLEKVFGKVTKVEKD